MSDAEEAIEDREDEVEEGVVEVLEPLFPSPSRLGGLAAAPFVPGRLSRTSGSWGMRFFIMRLMATWSRATGWFSESACATVARARTRAREQKSVRETFLGLDTNMVVV